MCTVFTLGIAVWLACGVALKETPMIVANSLTLVMACSVLVMRLRYGNRNKANPA